MLEWRSVSLLTVIEVSVAVALKCPFRKASRGYSLFPQSAVEKHLRCDCKGTHSPCTFITEEAAIATTRLTLGGSWDWLTEVAVATALKLMTYRN